MGKQFPRYDTVKLVTVDSVPAPVTTLTRKVPAAASSE